MTLARICGCSWCGKSVPDDGLTVYCSDTCADQAAGFRCSECGMDCSGFPYPGQRCSDCDDVYQRELVRVDDEASEALWREDNPEETDL